MSQNRRVNVAQGFSKRSEDPPFLLGGSLADNPKRVALQKLYRIKKKEITGRLREFKNLWRYGTDEDIFAELCFCLLTPQSKAISCWDAVCEIRERGFLRKSSTRKVAECLKKKVRFHNHKTDYIITARKLFSENGKLKIKEKIKKVLKSPSPPFIKGEERGIREWLVKNVKGFGYKEASHFLRNIGFGKDIAILDRHILKNLKALGVIRAIPENLTKRRYFAIEEKMKNFAGNIRIPVEALDLLFWSKETGSIFK